MRARPQAKPRGNCPALAGAQAKLAVGAAHDRHEYEADRIADRVVRGSPSPGAPPALISGLAAQRAPLPSIAARPPEQKEDESPAPPEKRAQRSPRGTGPEKPAKSNEKKQPKEDTPAPKPESKPAAKPAPKAPAAAPKAAKPAPTPAAAPAAKSGKEPDEKPAAKSGAKSKPAASGRKPAQRAAKPGKTAAGKDSAAGGAASKADPTGAKAGPPPKHGSDSAASKNADKAGAKSGSDKAAQAPGAEGGEAPTGVEARIDRMRQGPAQKLGDPLRDKMEPHLGQDLGGVRMHTDRAAGEAADALNAKAFTVGNDVFFGPGQYDPESSGGLHLIAHEVAHTVQQGGGSMASRRIQRAPKKAEDKASTSGKTEEEQKPAEKVTEISGEGWSIKLEAAGKAKGTVTMPSLKLPSVGGTLKGSAGSLAAPAAEGGRSLPSAGAEFRLDPVGERGEGKAFETWVAYAKTNFAAGLKTKLDAQLKAQGDAASVAKNGAPVYVLYSGGKAAGAETMIVGTVEQLSQHDSLLRPMLGPKGGKASLDADHALELQIGGADSAENMWLLDSDTNQTSGGVVKGDLEKSINETLKAADKELKKSKAEPASPLPTSAVEVKRSWLMVFTTVAAGKSFGTKTYWTRAQVRDGEHLQHFKAMTEKELVQQGFLFKEGEVPTHINVFPTPGGGRPVRFAVSKDGTTLQKPGFFYRGYEVIGDSPFTAPTSGNMGGVLTTLQIRRTKKKDKKSDVLVFADATLTVQHSESLGFGGYITRDSLSAAFRGADFKPLSPITFSNVQITGDGEIVAEGSVLSSKNLLPKLNVPLMLRGDEVVLQFPVPTEGLDFGPVSVTDAALELGVGADGFFIQGAAGVSIDQVGRGTLSARGTSDNVVIEGVFNLDLSFLEKAEVTCKYSLKDDAFSAKAELQVKAGSLPGVESGTVNVNASRESFGLAGSLNLGGILKGSTIGVDYGPETGLSIEGKDLPLPVDRLPGVSGATVTVRAVRSPEGEGWKISGGGSAKLAAAGASGTFAITYDGEAVTMKARAEVEKGPASGWLDVTATNAATDGEGNPVEGGPVGDLRIWGKGEATVKFGKVLTGKAGIEYTPEGKVLLSGTIALPPTFDLFDKKEYAKSLLKISTPDFPIWGVKVGPVGIGIFAYADTEVSFNAFVGPGQLKDTALTANLDLDKPEDATVTGSATFFVPSYAGLKLDLGGGLKAQAAVAYVKGRVGLTGELGLGLDGSFQVDVSWNRNDGFAVGAEAKIEASPKFKVGVTASVYAGVDLGITELEKEWGPWNKTLGEFGPDMKLGASFPLGWSEKDGLDLSLDKITITKPSLDAKSILDSAFNSIAP